RLQRLYRGRRAPGVPGLRDRRRHSEAVHRETAYRAGKPYHRSRHAGFEPNARDQSGRMTGPGGSTSHGYESATPPPQLMADFLDGALHDLVAPLNQSAALVLLLTRKHAGLATDPEAQTVIAYITDAVNRMTAFSEGLRTVVQVLTTTEAMRTVDMNTALSTATGACRDAVDAGQLLIESDRLPIV